jgi:hypothetical protein
MTEKFTIEEKRDLLGDPELRAYLERIKADTEKMPQNSDLVYLYGQTLENEDLIFSEVPHFPQGKIAFIGDDETEASGFPGFTHWKEKLLSQGLLSERIVGIPGCFHIDPVDGKFKGNTLTEAQALVEYAKNNDLKKVVIVCAPFHLPRCFVTVASVVLKERERNPDFELRVYAKAANLVRSETMSEKNPWLKSSVHSQGKVVSRLIDFLPGEFNRIRLYHEKGDLASIAEVQKYLDWRDSQS